MMRNLARSGVCRHKVTHNHNQPTTLRTRDQRRLPALPPTKSAMHTFLLMGGPDAVQLLINYVAQTAHDAVHRARINHAGRASVAIIVPLEAMQYR